MPPVRAAAPAGSSAVTAADRAITSHIDAPVSVDIFENGAGQIDVGPVNARAVYDMYHLAAHGKDGNNWVAEPLEGDAKGKFAANSVANLARKLANAHGVTGAVSIEDERGKGKSLTQRFEHTVKAPAPTARTAASAAVDTRELDYLKGLGEPFHIDENAPAAWRRLLAQGKVEPTGGSYDGKPLYRVAEAAPAASKRGSVEAKIATKEREVETLQGRVSMAKEARVSAGGRQQSAREQTANRKLAEASNALRELRQQGEAPAAPAAGRTVHPAPYNPATAAGAALPPRREGEGDAMYSIRSAVSDSAAETLLRGYTIPGLKAMARSAGIPVPSSASKDSLIAALMLPRRRYWDSVAVERQSR